MTVIKSNVVTDADNKDIQVGQGNHAAEKVAFARLATGGAAANNTVLLLTEIPVNAKITSIRLFSDDHGDTGDVNIGFYPGPGSGVDIADDSDAVDEDAIGTAIDINAAVLSDVEVRFETKDITTIDDKAWELAGLSAEPDYGTFYLAGTLSEATTADGDITVVVRYTQ